MIFNTKAEQRGRRSAISVKAISVTADAYNSCNGVRKGNKQAPAQAGWGQTGQG